MADGLAYVQKHFPVDRVIDMATLTGENLNIKHNSISSCRNFHRAYARRFHHGIGRNYSKSLLKRRRASQEYRRAWEKDGRELLADAYQ